MSKNMDKPRGCKSCEILREWCDESYSCPFNFSLEWNSFEDVPDYVADENCPIVKASETSDRVDSESQQKQPFGCIGISENRMRHIIGVARKAYKLAKERWDDEAFARKCFMLGWLHDVGYEFSETQVEHAHISAELMSLVGYPDAAAYHAIDEHSQPTDRMSDEYIILTMADMTVDSNGNDVTAEERLEDIRRRYGEESEQYTTCFEVCKRIGLVK